MAPAKRYVVPRWADVFSLDENPAIIAAEPDSLMTRAIGLSMLRTDGETHARQRQAGHRMLRVKEFQARWAGMLEATDTKLGDVELPLGTRIGVLLASANRDERHWEDPDRFDLRRATQRHIAFSRGPHVCLGAFVAGQQVGHSALPRLFARFPRLRLVDGFEARQIGWVFRGLASLDVTWG
jgi:cytochrome P450